MRVTLKWLVIDGSLRRAEAQVRAFPPGARSGFPPAPGSGSSCRGNAESLRPDAAFGVVTAALVVPWIVASGYVALSGRVPAGFEVDQA